MSLKKILLFTVGFSVCALAAGVYTTGSVADGWRTNGANDVMIQSYAGACHRADSGGGDYFVPSRTPAEWNAVTTQPPGGLTITACACEPLAIQGCPVANGTSSQQCWTNGAAWTACSVPVCNAGYTLSGATCVPAVSYVYNWRTYAPGITAYFTTGAAPGHGSWNSLEDYCSQEVVGASPWNAGASNVSDSYCNPATKTGYRCAWESQIDSNVWIMECGH